MTRVARWVAVAGLGLALMAPGTARAQAVGQPVWELDVDVDGSSVYVDWRREVGMIRYGHTLYASMLPGGALVARHYVPPTLNPEILRPSAYFPIVPPGTYYVLVLVGQGPPMPEHLGSWVRVDVGAGCTVPPDAPYLESDAVPGGSLASLEWFPAEDGCATESYALDAGYSSGATDAASIPMASTRYGGNPPIGTYFVRVRSINRFGSSPPSNEIVLNVAGCNTPSWPENVSASVVGHTVHISWLPPNTGGVSTITGYRLVALIMPVGIPVVIETAGAGTSYTAANVPSGTYLIHVVARTTCPGGLGLMTQPVSVTVP